MWGFQAAGAAPLVAGQPIDHPETVATAIRIGNPASWDLAVDARDASGGRISAVTDEQILAAHRELARLEGVFCEPSSATSVAGVTAAAAAGEVDRDALVVCVLTGNGLKDPTTAEARPPIDVVEAEPPSAPSAWGARLVVRPVATLAGRSSPAGALPSRSRPRRPTSARAMTAWGSRWSSRTGSGRGAPGAARSSWP